MFRPESLPYHGSLISVIPRGWRDPIVDRIHDYEARRARHAAQKSALRLKKYLLDNPQNASFPTFLHDSRIVNITVRNTNRFDSLNDPRIRKRPQKDHIEVSIRGEEGKQCGYQVSWDLTRQNLVYYREYSQGETASIYEDPMAIGGYDAYKKETRIGIKRSLLYSVYSRCENIFNTLLTSLTAQQSAERLP